MRKLYTLLAGFFLTLVLLQAKAQIQNELSNFTFIVSGTEVTFTNNDSATHTVVFDSFDSGDLKPGDSYKHTFTNKGTFNYHCSIHPSMKGKVTVQ